MDTLQIIVLPMVTVAGLLMGGLALNSLGVFADFRLSEIGYAYSHTANA